MTIRPFERRVWHVERRPSEPRRVRGAVAVTGDAREGLRALHSAAVETGLRPPPGYAEEVAQTRQRWQERLTSEVCRRDGEALSQGELIRAVNEEAQDGDTVVRRGRR